MKILRKILKAFLIIIAALVLGFIGLIVYAMISDYNPKEKEVISQSNNSSSLNDSLTLSILTWNIGYAGLDKDMDFFKDGGTKVITPEDKCLDNISHIGDFLLKNDTIDFILLQYRGHLFQVAQFVLEKNRNLVGHGQLCSIMHQLNIKRDRRTR